MGPCESIRVRIQGDVRDQCQRSAVSLSGVRCVSPESYHTSTISYFWIQGAALFPVSPCPPLAAEMMRLAATAAGRLADADMLAWGELLRKCSW